MSQLENAMAPANGADWKAEAKRIAAAFEVAGFPRGKGFLHRIEAQILKAGPYCPPTIHGDKNQTQVIIRSYNKSAFHSPIHVYTPAMWLKWAFCLGFDTAQLESDFGLTITAHERLEWMLEMKARGFEVPKT